MHAFAQLLHQSQPRAFNVLRAGHWDASTGKDYPHHQHTSWEITYYRSGQVECPIGGDVYQGRPGVLLVIPPGVSHSTIARTAYQNFWIQFDGPDLAWPRMCVDSSDHTIGRLCAAIVREFQEQALGYAEMNALLLGQLYIVLSRMQEQPKMAAAEQLIRFVEIIVAERYRTPLRVNEIAREVGVSDAYLRAQFVRLRGHTPSEHVQMVRVKHALALLQTSTLTLESIAESCGYNSASHLTRHIKRATGKTPGALRGW
jgi:AraC-like DNA-binding protein